MSLCNGIECHFILIVPANGYAVAMLTVRTLLIWLAFAPVCFGDEVDFEKDVAVILETRCLSCHNEAQAGGDLRLDTREHVEAVISPDMPESSLLLQQISGDEPEMPKDGSPLSQAEVEKLRQWIASGAKWPADRLLRDKPQRDLGWWSLRPIPKSSPPSAGHPVDAFLNAKLASNQLLPLALADPQTLLRRVFFDLIGLPPTPEQCDAFEQACQSESGVNAAYERLVDELLASPAFGEHWARRWLDVARYGETHGYDKDQPRSNAWPYRDYVIRSFNQDKPLNRFAQEQIAGDAMFPGDTDGILGLGFLAAGPWDLIGHVEVGEGKTDGRIAKHLDRDEMIAAVFNAFTSTTVQCAQCHHHKFDPVTMEDYYRLHAVFAAVDRADRVYQGLPIQQEQQRLALLARIKAVEADRNAIEATLVQKVAERTRSINERIAVLKSEFANDLMPQYGWHSQIASNANEAKWVQVDLGSVREIATINLYPCYDDFANIGAGFGFPVSYRVEVSNDVNFKVDVRSIYSNATPEPRGSVVTIPVQSDPFQFIRVTATTLAPRQNDYIFALGELQALGHESESGDGSVNHALHASVTSLDTIESGDRWSRANLTDGIYFQELRSADAMSELIELRARRDAVEAEIRTPEVTARAKALDDELLSLSRQLKAFPEGDKVFAVATHFNAQGSFVATGGKARPIHWLVRGDIRKPSVLMHPGMMPLWPSAKAEFELPNDAPESLSRAMLAQAITDQDNPLFWRSLANRVWQWTFGQAIVTTPNDFGRMGALPTHPELLDWLAAELRDDPRHSLKSLVRLLVTSDAYRRSSEHDQTNSAIDANNHFLWRANRRRLSAEEIRDAILHVSGKLAVDDRGGPSFRDFVIEKPEHSPHYEYDMHSPNDPQTHRRSVYRFVVRSQPQPFLTSLDCADPSLSVASRDESTTAIQALTLWNSRFTETFAKHFAERLKQEPNDEAVVELAVKLALGRKPNELEANVLQDHLRKYGGESLARIIFNMNAFLYVD
jgi:hypothetical protein